MKILIFGLTGMLGSAVFKYLSTDVRYQVFGTIRSASGLRFFPKHHHPFVYSDVDVLDDLSLIRTFSSVRPDVVINCIGLVKQLADSADPIRSIPINSMLPHRLAALCRLSGSRLIHFSTDCVFSGEKGSYRESDKCDPVDLYGHTKLIGEVSNSVDLTLRTSIIGEELSGGRALVGWFLSQTRSVSGYSRAVFSGLPTFEVGRVLADYVLPRADLTGLYHLSAAPITKYDLLLLLRSIYRIDIDILNDESLVLDRSLNSSRFTEACGYVAPGWHQLVSSMFNFHRGV